MAKHTINGFIVYRTATYWNDDERVTFYAFDPRCPEFNDVIICPHEFEIEVPDDFDPRPQQVKNLEAQIAKEQAEHTAKVTEWRRQIASLLALDNGVAA